MLVEDADSGAGAPATWPALAAEEIFDQSSEIHLKVVCDFAKNGVESAHGEFLVGGDCDVVLGTLLLRGQAEMTAGLAGDLIPGFHRGRTGVSRGNDLVLHKVKANQSRRILRLKVAAHGVLRGGPQFLQRFRLREYGVAEGFGFVAALGRFLHRKNDFAVGHWHDSGRD